ncbi:MAG: universal stress protein [Chloroflexi bacterium]|nr:universal stress protein [Chloroflexota bacterium]MQC18774.1 universal stress protein [Chloroflexota bacterium]
MPRTEPDVQSYLVAVDGSDAAYAALGAVCDAARRTKATVAVLYVIEVPRSLALDAELERDVDRGERILAKAEKVASDRGVSVQADLIQARQAGHAVVDEAVDRGVQSIVLGVEYHRPLGQFTLGRLPLYVLEHAPMQVWLIRYPALQAAPQPGR